MDNQVESAEDLPQAKSLIDQMKEDPSRIGIPVESWSDEKQGFLLTRAKFGYTQSEDPEIVSRDYANVDNASQMHYTGQFTAWYKKEKLSGLDLTRYGETKAHANQKFEIIDTEREQISFQNFDESNKHITFTQVKPGREMVVGYDKDGNVTRFYMDAWNSQNHSDIGYEIHIDPKTIHEIIKQEIKTGRVLLPVDNHEQSTVISVVRGENFITIQIVSEYGIDELSIPISVDVQEVIDDLELGRLLEDPRIHDTEEDVWMDKSLKRVMKIGWQQYDNEGGSV